MELVEDSIYWKELLDILMEREVKEVCMIYMSTLKYLRPEKMDSFEITNYYNDDDTFHVSGTVITFGGKKRNMFLHIPVEDMSRTTRNIFVNSCDEFAKIKAILEKM
jgi:hypothetical protein